MLGGGSDSIVEFDIETDFDIEITGDLVSHICVCGMCNVGWMDSVGMYLALATGHGNVDETAGVQNTLVGAALGGLLLLLGLNLYSEDQLGWRFLWFSRYDASV